MFPHILLFIFAFVIATSAASPANGTKRFPDDFMFGVATAAYQIEGAWNVDGKGPSIWDEFTHKQPEKIKDHSNADVGANSYEYYLDDIAAIKNLSMDHYRFSISWSRVLPTGDVSNVNEKGIEYYNKIIDKLLELNIQPMVTMYHYDLPARLQEFGGLTNSLIMVDYFKAYANLLFERFGDRVKYWITFNEPAAFCKQGYGRDVHAPGLGFNGLGDYLCGHSVLKSHATVYHLYKEKYYQRFKGQIGITLDTFFYYSDTNESHAERAIQFFLGWFAHPIFSAEGDYPDVMRSRIDYNSVQEGRQTSRLPTFSKEWVHKIRGSADFLGLNYYTSRFVVLPNEHEPEGKSPSIERDRNLKDVTKPDFKPSASEWLYSYPKGLGDVLRWIKHNYNNVPVIITENGWSDKGELEDNGRIEYYHDHLQQVQDAILNDGCNVKGFTAWSIIDNFEWAMGYTEKFGMYAVNLTSPRKERIPKKSSEYMRKITTTHQIPDIY